MCQRWVQEKIREEKLMPRPQSTCGACAWAVPIATGGTVPGSPIVACLWADPWPPTSHWRHHGLLVMVPQCMRAPNADAEGCPAASLAEICQTEVLSAHLQLACAKLVGWKSSTFRETSEAWNGMVFKHLLDQQPAHLKFSLQH